MQFKFTSSAQAPKSEGFDPRLVSPDGQISEEMRKYCEYVRLTKEANKQESQGIWNKTNDWWEMYLAEQEDNRDPVDESWRSDIFVPLPSSTTNTKAAQITETIGNTEPIWQVEATRETGHWYEQARHYQLLLDYTCRANSWRKTVWKQALSRSVQGTTFLKTVWQKRAHTTFVGTTPKQIERFQQAISRAEAAGAPQAPDPYADPEGFKQWSELVNQADKFGRIPARPDPGNYEIVEYEGPVFYQLPLWSVYVDPMIDEMRDQKVIVHRMVKPLSYVINRADDDPNSEKPYIRQNVMKAMGGWDGKVLQEQEEELAGLAGVNPQKTSHPYYEKPVLLEEVWTPEEPFKYSLIMNETYVINKDPFKNPLLCSSPNILVLRNWIVPGHFYGLSDYQQPQKLFQELNKFRRLRMDAATLTTLPVFVKQASLQIGDQLRKIRPGMFINAPHADAVQSLIKHQMPAEAYREPAEIKQEIEDATGIYSSTKGAPATVGRVTGVEFQGRSNATTLKSKIEASLIEEEWIDLPKVIIAFWAQMGDDELRVEIGGEPDAALDVDKRGLIQALGYRFRFRGATKNVNPDLAVQQITTNLKQFSNDLTSTERRFALQLIMEMLDIRGGSKIISLEGTQALAMQNMAQVQAQTSGAQAQNQQNQQAQVPVPPTVDAGAMEG